MDRTSRTRRSRSAANRGAWTRGLRGSRRPAPRRGDAQPAAAAEGLQRGFAPVPGGPGPRTPGGRLGPAAAAGTGVSARGAVILPAMKLDRRQFIAFSSGALAVTPITRVFAAAQAQAPASAQTPAPPAVAKFDDVRRNVGTCTMRGRTIGWVVTKD